MRRVLLITVLAISNLAFAEIPVPNSPDEKLNSIGRGVDTNKNGLRDDVEIYIYNKITNEPKLFTYYFNFAHSIENLTFSKSIEEAKKWDSLSSKAEECIYTLKPSGSVEVVINLKKIILNNQERKALFNKITDQYQPVFQKVTSKEERIKKCNL